MILLVLHKRMRALAGILGTPEAGFYTHRVRHSCRNKPACALRQTATHVLVSGLGRLQLEYARDELLELLHHVRSHL